MGGVPAFTVLESQPYEGPGVSHSAHLLKLPNPDPPLVFIEHGRSAVPRHRSHRRLGRRLVPEAQSWQVTVKLYFSARPDR